MKKCLFFLILTVTFICAGHAGASSLGVTGLVRQPLNLTLENLNRFQKIRVQLNEIMTDGAYRGVFIYEGVPLKTLLETAWIEKEETAFSKKVDLAVLVRNSTGEQVALSWGEIFYKNPGRIIVAVSASPVMPHKECSACHTPDEYKPRLEQLNRKIGFPKLVMAGDRFADRSLEGITSIEVRDLHPKMPARKMDKLFSPEFTITGAVKKEIKLNELPALPRKTLTVKHVGEGKGFHGINRFEGVSFRTMLEEAGILTSLDTVFFISAPDGYRSLFSYGELFLDPLGDRVILADRMDGRPMDKNGRFCLVPPDDTMLDRDVKAVEKIEVISLQKEPKLYVIGVGSGDTNLITLEAVSAVSRADLLVCPPDIRKRFSKYLGDKPVLMDIYEFAPPVVRKQNPGLSQEELDEIFDRKRARAAGIIRKAMDGNKVVALLDYGDPTVWSGSEYVREHIPENLIEVIPGLSSFNVANAVIDRPIGCNGSIVVTTPRGILGNKILFEAVAKKGETACIFMGLKELPELASFFKTCYPGDTPAMLVYRAGYAGSEHAVSTTLSEMVKEADAYPEKFLGLVYIGPCLGSEKRMPH